MILWLAVSLAFADAIPGPDGSCPNGSDWAISHSYSYCAPNECNTDEQCWEGKQCTENVGVCVVEREYSCNSGRMMNEAPCTFKAQEAVGTCSSQSDCAEGTCSIGKRCASSMFSGCAVGCGSCAGSEAPKDDKTGAALLLFLLPVATLRRRLFRSR